MPPDESGLLAVPLGPFAQLALAPGEPQVFPGAVQPLPKPQQSPKKWDVRKEEYHEV